MSNVQSAVSVLQRATIPPSLFLQCGCRGLHRIATHPCSHLFHRLTLVIYRKKKEAEPAQHQSSSLLPSVFIGSSSRPSPRRMKGGLLLAAAGGAAIALSTITSTAFVLPPPPHMRKQQQAHRPLQVKTGNNYGASSSSSRPLQPSEVLADSVGTLRLALRDALWRADDAIQAKVRPAVASFNDTAVTERVMAAFQQAVSKKPRAAAARPEPTIATFATVSSPPPPSATASVGGSASSGVLKTATMAATTAAAAVAVPPPPPPVTRVQPPPPPPRMPPPSNKNDDEDKDTKAKAAASTPSTSIKSGVTVVEKPAVSIPPPAAPQVAAPKAPPAATTTITAAVTPATTAASSSSPRAVTPPPSPVKTARQLVEEKARSTKSASPFAASVASAVGAEKEDPQVVRARSQRWAEDVVRRARQRSVEQAQAQAKAQATTVVLKDTGRARRRREEEKAAERARKVKVLEAAARLRAERAAALAEREKDLVVAAKVVKVEKKETVVNLAPAAAVVSAKAPPQVPTVGALMAAAAKKAEAAVTKAEAVLPTPVTAAVPATAAAAVAAAAAAPAAPAAVITPMVEEEEDPQPDRKSVETMLRDSKEKAVEEWHRARSSTTTEGAVAAQEDGVSKAEQLEQRLVDEIRAGPGAGILGCVELLEQHQAAQAGAAVVSPTEGEVFGRWDLAYSSRPVAPLLGLKPRWLARFLVGVSATVERSSSDSSKVAVVYNAVFKFFFSWLPRLRRTQRAAVTVDEQQQVEVLSSPPRFTIGRGRLSLSFSLPRFGFGKKGKEPMVQLTNTCTYLGSTLKICRLARPSASGAAAEPLVAVYLRKDPALAVDNDDTAAVMAAPLSGRNNGIRSPAVSKLFQRFNKRSIPTPPAAAAAAA